MKVKLVLIFGGKILLTFTSVAMEGGSSGSTRWGHTLSGNIAWSYPSTTIHCINASPKKYVSLIFGDLFESKYIIIINIIIFLHGLGRLTCSGIDALLPRMSPPCRGGGCVPQ